MGSCNICPTKTQFVKKKNKNKKLKDIRGSNKFLKTKNVKGEEKGESHMYVECFKGI